MVNTVYVKKNRELHLGMTICPGCYALPQLLEGKGVEGRGALRARVSSIMVEELSHRNLA